METRDRQRLFGHMRRLGAVLGRLVAVLGRRGRLGAALGPWARASGPWGPENPTPESLEGPQGPEHPPTLEDPQKTQDIDRDENLFPLNFC